MLESPLPVVVERRGALCVLTLNRPDKLNAFTTAMLAALDEALDTAVNDPATRAIAITGAGSKAFAAGNDVERLASLDTIAAYRDMVDGQRVLMRVHECRKPTIAMVNGYALGGGFELALACDFVVASRAARFGFPEITLNTMPGWGGTQLAVAKLGLARAKQMILSGALYRADECAAFGFIHRLTEPEQLLATVNDLAATLANYDGFAYEMAKRAVNRAGELPLAAGLDLEAAQYAVNFGSEAARAGLHQFVARRSSARANSPAPFPSRSDPAAE
ncbi:enoyl-CoA hydratase/isomerase family protein [Paraburkholderia acidipaludis]|uniref:enoyl-CoA hydratase/isomerase family protein n=1 Tax=Paraburkholderia acidipaludis TaxID=660537 RepID=UPI0005B887D9|nr:enoyl-CoA hydratase/isomerase family protein [Paraburkholderia acidipaludis]